MIICIFIFWGIAGCSQQEDVIPSFPQIDNPLDREDKLKSTIKEATDFEEINITIENEIEILRLSTNGERYNGWIKKSYIINDHIIIVHVSNYSCGLGIIAIWIVI